MGKFATQKRKKRKFCGNRFTKRCRNEEDQKNGLETEKNDEQGDKGSENNNNMASGNSPTTSASSRKLGARLRQYSATKKAVNDHNISGYRLCDMELLFNVFSLLKCPGCSGSSLALEEAHVSRKGCASTQSFDWCAENASGSICFGLRNEKVKALRSTVAWFME